MGARSHASHKTRIFPSSPASPHGDRRALAFPFCPPSANLGFSLAAFPEEDLVAAASGRAFDRKLQYARVGCCWKTILPSSLPSSGHAEKPSGDGYQYGTGSYHGEACGGTQHGRLDHNHGSHGRTFHAVRRLQSRLDRLGQRHAVNFADSRQHNSCLSCSTMISPLLLAYLSTEDFPGPRATKVGKSD